jgi:hypothetical protein
VKITVVVTCTMMAVVYTIARCRCGNRLMDIPGEVLPEVRILASEAHRSGRGRAILCKKCKELCEVIEHRKAA